MRKRETLTAFLFLAPAFLIVGVFGLLPIFHSIYLSLFRWSLKPGPFLGLGNYEELFGSGQNLAVVVALVAGMAAAFFGLHPRHRPWIHWTARGVLTALAVCLFLFLGQVWSDGDSDMLRSLQVTFWFALGTVPTQMVIGLLLALALDAKFQGRTWFRVLFLIPYVVPVVASAGVFDLLFSLRPESLANQFLHFWGVGPWQWLREPKGIVGMMGLGWAPDASASWLASWLTGPSLALVCILLFNNWIFSGYYALIFSNGLAAIPREIYEAAKLDGAKRSTVFLRITLPLLSPTSYFLALLGVIGTFKAFTSVYILRDAAVGGVTDPTSVYIFFKFFRELRYGYAAALAVVLFLNVVALTLIQRRSLEKRVFYG